MVQPHLCAVLVVLCCGGVLLAHAYDNGFGATPPMGWNTWCTEDVCGMVDRCHEDLIRSVADSIVEQGLDKLGYRFLNMDDCWSSTSRNASGFLQPDPTLFPSGMAALADYVHARGLYLGIYICVGTSTCRGGRPGSYGYYERDAQTLASWGIDFVKADNCHHPGGVQTIDLYTNLSRALNSTGRPMLFSLCEWGVDSVQKWGGDVGQMYRIQMDHLPLWELPTHAAGEGFGQGVLDIIEYVATLQPSTFVRPYAWMDPDFLETMFPITLGGPESRTEFTMWCMWSAPLIVATDLRNLTGIKRDIVTNAELIAVNQDPLFVAADRVAAYNNTRVSIWTRPLHNGDVAVAVVNANDVSTYSIQVTWDLLGWPASARASVRDMWAHKDLGAFGSGGFAVTVGPHDTAAVRVTRLSGIRVRVH